LLEIASLLAVFAYLDHPLTLPFLPSEPSRPTAAGSSRHTR